MTDLRFAICDCDLRFAIWNSKAAEGEEGLVVAGRGVLRESGDGGADGVDDLIGRGGGGIQKNLIEATRAEKAAGLV